MLLEELFASMRKHYGSSTQPSADNEGIELKKRLHELLDLEKPIKTKQTLSEPKMKST